jgi:hypothetical protein
MIPDRDEEDLIQDRRNHCFLCLLGIPKGEPDNIIHVDFKSKCQVENNVLQIKEYISTNPFHPPEPKPKLHKRILNKIKKIKSKFKRK